MTSILIDHGCYDNIGDIAMLEGVTNRLLGCFPDIEISVIYRPFESQIWQNARITQASDFNIQSNLEHSLSKSFKHQLPAPLKRVCSQVTKFSGRLNFRLVETSLQPEEYDFLLINGGGYLTDVFAFDMVKKATLIQTFSGLGKPVILTGQQIGPFRVPFYRSIAIKGLREASFVGVRDPVDSMQFCHQYLHDITPFLLMGDDSFGIQPSGDDLVFKILKDIGIEQGKFLTINLQNRTGIYSNPDAYLAGFCELVDSIAQSLDLPVLFVPIRTNDKEGDDQIARLIFQRMAYRNFHILEVDPLSPHLVLGILGKAYGAIGTSFHFNTFSLRSGVPSICFYDGRYFSQKARALAAFWGDSRLLLASTQLDLPGNAIKIQALFEDPAIRKHLSQRSESAIKVWETAFDQAVSSALGIQQQ